MCASSFSCLRRSSTAAPTAARMANGAAIHSTTSTTPLADRPTLQRRLNFLRLGFIWDISGGMPPTGAAARPTSLTVFGVLNLFFALFSAYGAFTNLALFMPSASAMASNPIYDIVHDHGAAKAWIVARIVVGVLQAAVLGLGGLGLLLGKSWGRLITLAYALGTIVFLVAAVPLDWITIMIPLREVLEPGDPIMIGAMSGMVGNVLGMIYPGCALFFLNRTNVRTFFAPSPVEEFA